MRLYWLEEMVKSGSVRPEFRDTVYKDCETILSKIADISPLGAASPVASIATTMLAAGMPLMADKLYDRYQVGQTQKTMLANRNLIAKDMTFGSSTEEALRRFDEIARIAPIVASNKELIINLVKKTMGKQLSSADLLTLAGTQATDVAKAKGQKDLVAGYNKTLDKHYKTASVQRHESATRLGDMYADVYILGKTASAAQTLTRGQKLMEGLKTTALVSSIPILAGLGTGAIQSLVARRSKIDMESQLENAYQKALSMSSNDSLHSDKDKARRAFETLVHFAPHVAAEPSAARAFMNKLVSYDMGIDAASIKELSEIERNLGQASKAPGFMQGFRAGTDATGLQRIISGGVGAAIDPTQKAMGGLLMPEGLISKSNAQDK